HSPMLTARIIPAVSVNAGNPACAHLLTGNRATVDISAGTLLTYDMVEEPQGSALWAMRRLQDRTFL
ncbi:SAF domain-containing protein, partial [Agrobacterium sp. MCAB5]|uniref:SAF domain-containing protein n=1 Tax=Agrobacterium sp. MCAB5 TaxID=3233042 RepID=UPI003F935D85